MRNPFSPPLPLPLASPKPALAFAVLCATPRRRLVAPRRLPSPLHPGPLTALRIAVHIPAVALAADHHQPATAPTAELPSFMGFGCWVCRVDEPPGRIETKFDLRSALCETRDLSTPLRDVDGYSRSATSSRTVEPASFFLMAAWNLRRSLLVPKKRGGVVRVHAATSLAHGITRIPVIADTLAAQQGKRVEGRRTKDEGRRTKDEGRRTKDEGRRTKDEGRRTKDEGRRTEVND